MSVRRLDPNQPPSFDFTPENLAWAKAQIEKYPEGRQQAAVLSVLWRAQEQNDQWLPEPAIRYVADLLDMPYIRVYEIATFYTMFNLSPVGRHHVQLCGTTPCMLRGADELKAVCEKVIGPHGQVTADGALSWVEVECLGACVNAPMAQINKDYYEDLTPENFEALLDALRNGREVKPGPQNGRQCSAPLSGPKTLRHEAAAAPSVGRHEGRAADEQATHTAAQAAAESLSPVASPKPKSGDLGKLDAARRRFAAEKGPADDFTKLGDIDTAAIHQLNELGLTRYGQIGRLSEEDRNWLESRYPRFKGRTAEWVEQAKALIATNTPGGPAPNAAGRRQGKGRDED